MEQQKNYDIPDICDETVKKQNKPEKTEEQPLAPKPEIIQPSEPETKLPEPEIQLPEPEKDGAELVPPVTPKAPDIPPREPVVAPEPPKYCWSYEEQSAHDSKKRRRSSGVLTYAIIMTIAFAVCFVALAGVIMYENGTFSPDVVRTIFVRQFDSDSGVLTVPEIANKVKPSVVGIEITAGSGLTARSGVGTGIIMSEDGYIATNYHVVEGAEQISVVLSDRREYPATYIGGDELSDLAMIKVDVTGLTPATFGNSDELVVGELAVAIGTPGGLDLAGTTTDGIISAISRDVKIYDDSGVMVKRMTLIQTNAAVNPGNSGGPLINDRGEVVGIVSMKLGGDFDGIGFAIPINGAMPILEDIKVHGSTQNSSGVASKRAIIGITAGGIEEGMEYELGDGSIGKADITGVIITEVTPGYDAANKVSPGDIITEVDGKKVYTVYDVMDIVNNKYAGDTVTVKFYRGGQYFTVDILLGAEQ